MQRSKQNSGNNLPERQCLRCGAVLVDVRCKVQCPRCGYTEDCSDAGLIDFEVVESRRNRRPKPTQAEQAPQSANRSTSR